MPRQSAQANQVSLQQLVVKFVEGSSIRLEEKRLVVSSQPSALETRSRLARLDLKVDLVDQEIAVFSKLVANIGGIIGRAAPDVGEVDLTNLRRKAESTSGHEQPDLNLFYFVHLPKLNPEASQKLLDEIKNHRIIETAYFSTDSL